MSLDPILAAACDLEDFCRVQGWRYCEIKEDFESLNRFDLLYARLKRALG
ncbi:MAG: hypothetical protein AB9869_21555 [Verrucomicrobiia bacterium]